MDNFKRRSSKWCEYDISINEGIQIDSFPLTHVLKQLMCEPTNINLSLPTL